MWWNWYCKAVGTAVLRIGWAGRREGSLGSRTGGWEATALLDVVPVVEEGWEEAGGVPVSPRAGVLPSGSVARPRVSDEGWRFLPPPSLQLVTSWSGRKRFLKKSSVHLEFRWWLYKTANSIMRGETNFGGGGLVRAHTTDRSRFFPCQLCPVLQLPSTWEIPRERRAEVGLRPLNLMWSWKPLTNQWSVTCWQSGRSENSPSCSTAFPFSWAHCFGPPVFVFCKKTKQKHRLITYEGGDLSETYIYRCKKWTHTSGLAVGEGFWRLVTDFGKASCGCDSGSCCIDAVELHKKQQTTFFLKGSVTYED